LNRSSRNWINLGYFALSLACTPIVAQTGGNATSSTVAASDAILNDAQKGEAQARLALALSVLDRLAKNDTSASLGPQWKQDAMNLLLDMPSRQIRAVADDSRWTDLKGVRTAAKSARANAKALGDQNTDLVYYPITPCRNVDTRLAGGPIAGGTARQFNADLAGSQGGTAGCGVVPLVDASAWAMNITVVNMNNLGFVAVRSVGATNLSSTANYTGPGQQVNNFVIVFNNRTAPSEWEVYAATTVDVIIDLYGYFLPPFKTALDCVTLTDASATLGANVLGYYINTPSCAAGYTMTAIGCATAIGIGVYVTQIDLAFADHGACQFANTTSSPVPLRLQTRCCRTPGR